MTPSRTTSHPPRPAPTGRPARGFTLIELMVGLAILAIVMRLAVPGITQMYKTNRVQTEASQFVSDLQLARAEAIRRGLPVSVCPSTNGTSCVANSSNWHAGWMVFFDRSGNCSVDTGDTALRVRAGFRGGDTFTASPAAPCVSFNREGFTAAPTAATLFTLHTSENIADATRCVSLEFGGRTATIKKNQTTTGGTTCS